MLHIVIQAVDILYAAHSLHSEKQVCKKAAFFFFVQSHFFRVLIVELVVPEPIFFVAFRKRIVVQWVLFVVIVYVIKPA